MSKSKSSAAAKVSESDAPAGAGADFTPEFVEEEPRGREEPSGPELAVVSPDEEFGVEALDVPPDLSVATSEIESIVPPKPPTAKEIEEGGGDSMLARYFREMATHAVMGPDEELRTAIEVETAEIEHWVQSSRTCPRPSTRSPRSRQTCRSRAGATRSSTRPRSPSFTSSSRPTRSSGTS